VAAEAIEGCCWGVIIGLILAMWEIIAPAGEMLLVQQVAEAETP
jgi:hypothetical protein